MASSLLLTLLFLRLHHIPQPILAPHRLRQLIDQLHRLDAHRDHLADEVGNVSLYVF